LLIVTIKFQPATCHLEIQHHHQHHITFSGFQVYEQGFSNSVTRFFLLLELEPTMVNSHLFDTEQLFGMYQLHSVVMPIMYMLFNVHSLVHYSFAALNKAATAAENCSRKS